MKSCMCHVMRLELDPLEMGTLERFRQRSNLDKFSEQDAHSVSLTPVTGTWEVFGMSLKSINSCFDSM